MPNLDLSLINAALTRTGNEPISELNDGSAAGTIAGENYEIVVRAELARSRFKLPSKIQQLNLIDEDESGSPPEPWSYGYTLPSELVKLHTVKVAGQPIAYVQMGRIIFCDYGSDSEVIAHYSWRIPESWFAPEFAEGIVRRMEAVFLRGIGERFEEADTRDDAANSQFSFARSSDSQAQSPSDPVSSPTLSARRGSVHAPSATLRARRG